MVSMLKRVQPSRSSAGFTMVELLMTMLLLSIVLMGLIALQVTTIRQVTSARRANEAVRLATSVLERHQRMTLGDISVIVPVGAWNTLLKKDQVSPMANVGVDGESAGPYTVDRMVETSVVGGIPFYLITIRVTWLDITPGAEVDPTQRYRTLDVLVSCRRSL
jgi:prepilin-type N-terminal cleavage/methylation domain-containing protein